MRLKISLSFLCFLGMFSCKAQTISDITVDSVAVKETLQYLSSDELRGRDIFDKHAIEKSAVFIANKFEEFGLKPYSESTKYFQEFDYKQKKQELLLKNVIGILPGKSKRDEMIVFSAHYDHIGIINDENEQDSIANGADDNASGVTALLELAKYYSIVNDNERTLVFVAFTAEEIGMIGSNYFSEKINLKKIVTMINLEMIGKEAKFGKNSAFITGYQYSSLGNILNKNINPQEFKFYPDPYPKQQLFFRSDNKSLALSGVPAHTISTVQIDKDNLYHTVKDEYESINTDNVIAVIKAITIGAKNIVSGKETPTRLKIK